MKAVHEWNDHLENFSCAQVIENSRQHLLLRTDFYRKQSSGAHEILHVGEVDLKLGTFKIFHLEFSSKEQES